MRETLRKTETTEFMTALRQLILAHPDTALTAGGFAIGLAFGAALSATNYCTMGAISDWRMAQSAGRLGAVALAAATAILGAQALDASGIANLSASMYLTPRINWLGALGGGLLFGAGMVYAGGCPSRGLVRAGSGDLRALLTLLIMAIAAYATISGILGSARAGLETATAIDLTASGARTQGLGAVLARAGLSAEVARAAAIVLIALPLLAFAFGRARLLTDPVNLFGGMAVGGLAVAGWAITGLAQDEFAVRPSAPQSLSFVRPVADAIDWIERSTALGLPGFGAASVFGTLIGALAVSVLRGRARIAGFADTRDMQRHVLGAVAMGVGGVLALGCSIGQGITGVSTLAVQSLLAAAAIYGGAVLALNRLEAEV